MRPLCQTTHPKVPIYISQDIEGYKSLIARPYESVNRAMPGSDPYCHPHSRLHHYHPHSRLHHYHPHYASRICGFRGDPPQSTHHKPPTIVRTGFSGRASRSYQTRVHMIPHRRESAHSPLDRTRQGVEDDVGLQQEQVRTICIIGRCGVRVRQFSTSWGSHSDISRGILS